MKIADEQLSLAFGSVFLRLSRLLDKRMARAGASLARTKVLMLIAREGTVKAADIAELFGLAPRTVTDTLDGMERQGLVSRAPDKKDRRVKRITLTDAGSKALAAAEPIRAELIAQVMGTLSDEERTTFAQVLEKLEQALASVEEAEGVGA